MLAVVVSNESPASELAYASLDAEGDAPFPVAQAAPADAANEPISPAGFVAPPAPTMGRQPALTTAAPEPLPPLTADGTPIVAVAPAACIACSHWFAGVDLGITDVEYSNGSFAIQDDRTGLSVAPYLGWESSRGGGFRVQAWLYGAETQAIEDVTHTPFDLDVAAVTIDFDVFQRLQIDSTSLVLGAGSRGAATEFTFPNSSEQSWTGAGLSIFADAYHPFRTTLVSEWGWIGGGRWGYLGGDEEFKNDNPYPEADHLFTTGEGYLGVQYRRHFDASAFVFQFRGQRQHWQSNMLGDIAFDTTAFRLGWEW